MTTACILCDLCFGIPCALISIIAILIGLGFIGLALAILHFLQKKGIVEAK